MGEVPPYIQPVPGTVLVQDFVKSHHDTSVRSKVFSPTTQEQTCNI